MDQRDAQPKRRHADRSDRVHHLFGCDRSVTGRRSTSRRTRSLRARRGSEVAFRTRNSLAAWLSCVQSRWQLAQSKGTSAVLPHTVSHAVDHDCVSATCEGSSDRSSLASCAVGTFVRPVLDHTKQESALAVKIVNTVHFHFPRISRCAQRWGGRGST